MSIRTVWVGLCLVLACSSLCPAAEPMDTEKAVSLGADWLAAHQLPDGGWSFNHAAAKGCDGKCGNAGDMVDARNAATSLAVLAMLAAGQGEKGAKHSMLLKGGLSFLAERGKVLVVEKKRLTFEEGGGSMYSHGLATLALCEAFRVTGDMSLREPAQLSLAHVLYAQDPVGGGWRYSPKQAGDTSATGWQVAALLSARGAMFDLPEEALTKANGFFDSVQADDGAKYGYTGPGAGQATTAIGLLYRRKLGWKRDQPSFVRGVEFLVATGPSKGNQYYNFYATQALRQADDDSWKSWRDKMEPIFIDTQVKDGHAAGSWMLHGDHGTPHGGRLYCTTLAMLILGVEQGKLPVFRK